MFSILIVDDNYYDREGVRDLVDWKALDMEIVGLAADGREGLAKALARKPDFVLTDIAMPLMDGIAMTREIKTQLPTTRFIFMSCFDEFAYARAAMELNVSSYVMKPVELNELTEALEKMKAIAMEETRRESTLADMKAIVQNSLPILRGEVIRDLLYNRITASADSIERLTYLGIHRDGIFRVILMLFDNANAKSADHIHRREVPVHPSGEGIRGIDPFHAEDRVSSDS
jgi:two-component system, response regulator YesN